MGTKPGSSQPARPFVSVIDFTQMWNMARVQAFCTNGFHQHMFYPVGEQREALVEGDTTPEMKQAAIGDLFEAIETHLRSKPPEICAESTRPRRPQDMHGFTPARYPHITSAVIEVLNIGGRQLVGGSDTTCANGTVLPRLDLHSDNLDVDMFATTMMTRESARCGEAIGVRSQARRR